MKVVAGLMAGVLSTTALAGGFKPVEGKFRCIDEVVIDTDLLEDEIMDADGEEKVIWPYVLAAIALAVKGSCENDWSYRDKERCVGKCDDYNKQQERKQMERQQRDMEQRRRENR